MEFGAAAGPDAASRLPLMAAKWFTGRDTEVGALNRALDGSDDRSPGTIAIAVISGTAGVGKTTLAIHWAHQVADRFPGGQLYVDLRGFGPSGPPVSPAEAARGFLDALGVAPERIPAAPDARAGLLRSLLADRRVLIVLDNARDDEQVRPLLPASPGSLVLVTSRSELAGLAAADGARLLSLDVLSPAEATQMLASRLGAARVAAEPDAVREVADLCSRLPLALAVAAGRAAIRPGFPLAALVAELRDSDTRIDALEAGDAAASVRAVFSWSYQRLSPDAARMFRLLGLHPGPDISVPAAASLAGTSQPEGRRLLAELSRTHLIAEHLPGRHTFHDLLRAYGASQARATDSHAERNAAIGRVLDHYLHTAARAARLLKPAQEPITLAAPRPGAAPEQPTDHRQALAWFENEHQVLLAAVTLSAQCGLDTHVWQLSWAMAPFLSTRGHYQQWAATQHAALAAATRLKDTAAQAVCSRFLGGACNSLGDGHEALRHFARSLALYQQLGDRLGEAKAQHNLGMLAECQGRYADGLRHTRQALRLYQAIGDQTCEAEALNTLGWTYSLAGDYQQARACCRQALALCADTGHRRHEGHILDSLGYAEHHLGNAAQAVACYQRAIDLHRESGDRFHEAEALIHLGDTRRAAELPGARDAWQRALRILDELGHQDAGQVRAKLAAAK